MLLRFSVSNYASLRDKQELSLIASKLKGDSKGLIEAPELRNETILPAAVIYGSNASGKSNFIKALTMMRNFVLNSHRGGEPGAPIVLKPFAFDHSYKSIPSTFSADFICNRSIYSYDFAVTSSGFPRESLRAIREGHTSLLFERTEGVFNFGRSLKGRNKIIEDLTRPNSLFLSAAAQNNHDELSIVANFFRRLRVARPTNSPLRIISAQLAYQGLPRRALDLLKAIDIGVSEFKVDELPTDGRPGRLVLRRRPAQFDLFGDPPQAEAHVDREREQRFRLGHSTRSGGTVFLDLEDESAGTVQLLLILEPIYRALEQGSVVVIDEFGSRLHTRASELILHMFNNRETNPNGAQLIAATHDTNLLSANGLRRDQVWFTEKDSDGASHLYPLTDFETRKDDNLEKGYLQGRFGAIPFAGSIATFPKDN
jgi:hypothetical protein